MSRLKINSRDKKPKLWNVLALSVLVFLTALFMIWGGDRYAFPFCILLDVYFILVLIFLISAFIKQFQYNPYSYNTIYYAGFSLFVISLLISFMILTMRMINEFGGTEYAWNSWDIIANSLLVSAKKYMLLSAPFILVFSAALCISNIVLIRHEGKRPVNILGILLSVALIGGEIFLFFFDRYASGSLDDIRRHELIINLFAALYLYFECMIIGSMIAMALVSRYEPDPDGDFLIILGCGIRKDGSPSPLLRGRCDKALDFRKRQLEKTGRDLIFVTSGGQGPDEVISESLSMKKYLMEQGIPDDMIIEEDRSTSTFENMAFSKEKIWEADPEGNVVFSTTNYHVFRGGLNARRVKMRAVGMGAKTKWYFWPNAAVREFVGLLTEHRLKQALVFLGMVVFYLLLTLYCYRY